MNGLDTNTVYWTFLLVSGGICASLVLYLVPYQKGTSARYLSLLMISVAEWCFSSAIEIKMTDLADKLFLVKLEYFGAAWVGVLFFFFILIITGKKTWLTRKRRFWLGILPVLTIILAVTNDFHGLIWANAWLDNSGPIPLVAYERGIGFWIYLFYSYLAILIGTCLLVKELFITSPSNRKKLLIVLLGTIVPWAANFIYLFDLGPVRYLDFTPFAFTFSGCVFAWGVFSYRLTSIISLAHKTIIEGMDDAVFVLDTRDEIIDLNNTASRLFNFSLNSGKDNHMSLRFPVLYDLITQHRKSGPTQNEVKLPVAEEDKNWNLRISPLFEKVNKPGGWLVILQDITDRIRAEESIRESEEKFRSITENAVDGIIMIDSDGKISFWNKAAESIFGYSADEAIGMNLHKALAPVESNKKYNQAFPHFRHTGDGFAIGKTLELTAVTKKGVEFPVELSLASLKLKGDWHAVGIVRDVTIRNQTQDLIIQSEKMISVGRLAAGMAHELNNPLGGMVQGAQTVLQRLSTHLKSNLEAAEASGVDLNQLQNYIEKREIKKYLNSMLNLGKRASIIINDMLKFSRKSESKKEITNLADSIRDSLELAQKDYDFKKNYDFKNINVITEFEADLPFVFCNRIEMEQVILNLLRNSAQAMTEGGQTKNPEIIIRLSAVAEAIQLEVEDNGPGMSASTYNRIFEPFYTTKPVGQGTGLGLSVSYMIVTNHHHGTMEVKSELGRGTTFVIQLPLNTTPPF